MKYTKLWLLVILVAGADIGTTVYGLSTGQEEGNPAVNEAIEEVGLLPALFALKMAAMTVAGMCQHILPKHEWVPASGLLTVWIPVVVWNTVLLLP
jgi:hypothetical protein